ncbi:hypothetical protein AB6A40_006286 [Gnathostoma spinigerum]|uniref:Abnormal cell migration protein 18-like fibronectin type I domain-containing protein n=1 Tax=Gnathostoma spinigerum TaxID=75299 RepID=A0ABD6ESC6_9BILA
MYCLMLVLMQMTNLMISLVDGRPSSVEQERSFILVPHGMSPDSSQRVIIPAVQSGEQPPFPCVIADVGTIEHGQTFTKGNFHYRCANGTADVIACVADDKSVIQIDRTFIRNGVKHKCTVDGETVTYRQESTCFENGIHYSTGDTFRNGSFRLACREEGIIIDGCYLQNTDEWMNVNSTRVIGHYKHSCQLVGVGKVRYTINLDGCRKGNQFFNEGQIWTDRHIRYQCSNDGTLKVQGEVNEINTDFLTAVL